MLRLLWVVALLLAVPAHAVPKKKPAPAKKATRPPVKPAGKPKKAGPPAPADAVDVLGRAHQLFVDGDYLGARKELDAIELGKLHNRDYALELLAQAELLTGEPAAALIHFQSLATLSGRFQTLARWRAADCLYALGKLADAQHAYEAVLPTANDSVEPAVARYRIGESLEAKKALPLAQAAYRRVYVEFPLHPLAERALDKLKALSAPEIAPIERIARAKLMTANRAWPRALEELALLPADLPPALRDEADYWFGTTKFKMRRDYDLAAQKLLGVWQRLPGEDRKAEALFHGARANSRADEDDKAIQGYRDVLTHFPHSRFAAEASFLIGWLDFNRAHYKDAIPSLEETLKRYGGSQFGDDARWYLGFSRWLSGDTVGALGDFEKLSTHSGALSGGKGAYWAGRALDKLGKKPEAVAKWRALVGAYPFSYYATQARVRLKEHDVELSPFGDGGKGTPPPFNGLDEQVAADPLIARVDELTKAGLTVEAGFELKRGEGELMKRYGSARALPVLLDRYVQGDDFHRPHQLAETFSGAALRLDPQADPTVRKWWEQMYPRAYRAFIEKYSATGDNPPYYLYTIMQKESAYNPHDVSYADAIGLLQMIPPTSRRVALRIDTPYTDDVLYDPEGNIRFGAWYIGHLLAKFKKQIPLGAGSYNAGPKAMMKWVKLNGERPLDEFIELCSYTQTREYMKKVIDIYGRYVYLYEKEDYQPDAKVDGVSLDDGIDY